MSDPELYQPLSPDEVSALLSDRPKPENAVTADSIRARISHVWFTVLTGVEGEARKTLCTIRLDNKFEVDGESIVVDPSNYNPHLGKHFAYQQAFGKLWEHFALLKMEDAFRAARVIELDGPELQSGFTRVQWAEGLIRQLPEDHEGRNSWLLNYGKKVE